MAGASSVDVRLENDEPLLDLGYGVVFDNLLRCVVDHAEVRVWNRTSYQLTMLTKRDWYYSLQKCDTTPTVRTCRWCGTIAKLMSYVGMKTILRSTGQLVP